MEGRFIIILGGTVLVPTLMLWYGKIVRRYDEAHFADVYGCFEHVPEKHVRKIKTNLYNYKKSWYNLVFKDVPYNLDQVFDGIDFEDDSPGYNSRASEFISINNEFNYSSSSSLCLPHGMQRS